VHLKHVDNMSMRRPQTKERIPLGAFSRSNVIDFREGFLADCEPPINALASDSGGFSTAAHVYAQPTDGLMDNAKEYWNKIMSWFHMTIKKRENDESVDVMKAQQALFQLSHYEATNVEALIATDVNAFASKYLSAFTPDTITQAQLTTMVTLGQDVANNSLCKYMHKYSQAQTDKTPQQQTPQEQTPQKQTPLHKSAYRSRSREDGDVATMRLEKKSAPNSVSESAPNSVSESAPNSVAESAPNSVADIDKMISIRELKPKLEKAVAETLHSYGIHEDGIIDTKKMARMHKLQQML
jgi:Ca2+-binding EF-hand superfamily protein